MKNLKTFTEFINESVLNEGVLAMKASKELEGINVFIEEFEDQEVKDLHIGICDLLGEDPSNVYRVDSESHDEDPISNKIYKYLDDNINASSVDISKFYDLSMGEDCNFDRKLNAIRYDDNGFVAYYFTKDSNF